MINIECTLHGSLEDNVPEDIRGNSIKLKFKQAPSVYELLRRLELDAEYLQFAMTEGHYIDIAEWNQPIEGNAIQLWPRMSGG